MENILPNPPPLVSICILGAIQAMDPLSVIILSPFSKWHITTGKEPPAISYHIASLLCVLGYPHHRCCALGRQAVITDFGKTVSRPIPQEAHPIRQT